MVLSLKSISKVLTIIIGTLLALILSRHGISYLIVLFALGLILPFLTDDKKSAVISGLLYAILSYAISYPSGLFLINYMPSKDIPIIVSQSEVSINLLIGLLIPVIVAIIICYVGTIIGEYLNHLLKKYGDNSQNQKHYFEFSEKSDEKYDNYKYTEPKNKQKLEELSHIQRAKTRKKFKRD